MEFVMKTVKDDTRGHTDPGEEILSEFHADNELLLGAALAVIATRPDACRNSRGRVDVRKLMQLLQEDAGELFGEREINPTSYKSKDLLESWLNKLDN